MTDLKEIKRKIRYLKKLKKGIKVGTEVRRDLNRKIRALKEELNYQYGDMTDEKKELIKKIREYNIKKNPCWKQLKIDLRTFTVEQLRYHYETKIKGKS